MHIPHVTAPTVAIAGTTDRFPIRRIFCVGQNYADHAREMGSDPDRQEPFFFSKPADAVVANGSTLPFPPKTEDLHHEVELVIALGAGIISTVPGLFDDVLGFLPLSAAQNALSGVVEGTDGTAGAVVGLHGTRREKLDEVAASLGDRVHVFPADLGDRAGRARVDRPGTCTGRAGRRPDRPRATDQRSGTRRRHRPGRSAGPRDRGRRRHGHAGPLVGGHADRGHARLRRGRRTRRPRRGEHR